MRGEEIEKNGLAICRQYEAVAKRSMEIPRVLVFDVSGTEIRIKIAQNYIALINHKGDEIEITEFVQKSIMQKLQAEFNSPMAALVAPEPAAPVPAIAMAPDVAISVPQTSLLQLRAATDQLRDQHFQLKARIERQQSQLLARIEVLEQGDQAEIAHHVNEKPFSLRH